MTVALGCDFVDMQLVDLKAKLAYQVHCCAQAFMSSE